MPNLVCHKQSGDGSRGEPGYANHIVIAIADTPESDKDSSPDVLACTDSAAMTSITLDPQTSRQQNRARFCKICQRESSSPACPWRRSLPCLLCCSAPGGRSCHPSFSPQSSCKTSAIRTVLGAKLSGLPPHEIGRCERALSDALNGASGLVRCCLWLLQLHQH